ncbi:MAG: acyltransferase family protein [Oscillospiraceae bacterium]|nr:acyltransferase family protein [Oscillospiraceae bacterium]
MTTSKRNISIDIMKGILIMLVVFGHSYWEYKKIIFWFHMPLFFMISGYLLHIPTKESESAWIIKKVKGYLIPYCAYALLSGLFKYPYGIKDIVTYWLRCLYGGEVAGGVYWFITVLLLSEITTVLLYNKIQNKKCLALIICIMYLAAIIESVSLIPPNTIQVPAYTKLPWNFDVCFIAIPYIYLGNVIQRNEAQIKTYLYSKVGTIAIIITGVVLVGVLIVTNAYNWFTLDLKYSQYKNFLLDLVCPAVVGVFLWMISSTIRRTKGGCYIAYIGQRSLSVMYLHLLIRDEFIIKIFGGHYPICIYVLIVLLISMLWDYIISKSRILSYLFGIKWSKE